MGADLNSETLKPSKTARSSMTQRTIDLLARIALEIVEWINIWLKEKRRPQHDGKRTSEKK
jgi:hypothetical protein